MESERRCFLEELAARLAFGVMRMSPSPSLSGCGVIDPMQFVCRYDEQTIGELGFGGVTTSLDKPVAGPVFIPVVSGGRMQESVDIRRMSGADTDEPVVDTAGLPQPGFAAKKAGAFGARRIARAVGTRQVCTPGERLIWGILPDGCRPAGLDVIKR